MYQVRKRWIRITILVVCLAILNLTFVLDADTATLRNQIVGVIPSISLLFAVTSALTLALVSNAVFGLRDKVFEQARKVRKVGWGLFDKYSGSSDQDVQNLLNDHINPMLQLRLEDYQDPNKYNEWYEDIESGLIRLRDSGKHYELFFRHLLPLEDELATLGLLFIRRVVVDIHTRLLLESFLLVIASMCILAVGSLLPYSVVLDIAISNIALGVMVYAPIQLLLVLSHLYQEAREESYTFSEDEESEDEPSNDS